MASIKVLFVSGLLAASTFAADFGIGWDPRFHRFPGPALVDAGGSPRAPGPIASLQDGSFLIGGRFTNLAGVDLLNLARWSGSNWSAPLPDRAGDIGIQFTGANDLTNGLYSIASSGAEILIGGRALTSAGDVPINNVALWNGSNWLDLSGGATGLVSAVSFSGTKVYAGGNFTSIGGVTATNIALWTNDAWEPIGDGVPFVPERFGFFGGELYVAGAPPTFAASHWLLRWTETEWVSLADAFPTSQPDRPLAFLSRPEGLYVGGAFTNIGGVAATNIALWTGTEWLPVGNGLPGRVVDLAIHQGELLAAGRFLPTFTNQTALARWDGTNWTIPSGLPILNARSMAVSDKGIFMRGKVETGLEETFNGAVFFDGNQWIPFGAGFGANTPVAALETRLAHLASSERGVTLAAKWGLSPRSQMRRWDGTIWERVHTSVLPFPFEINAFALQDTHFWVGTITTGSPWNIPLPAQLGGTDGTNWFGGTSPGKISAITVAGAKVFAGGTLGLYEWNGTQFSSTYPIYTNFVTSLASDGNTLYVAGGPQPNGPRYTVSRFDGQTWTTLGGTISNRPGFPLGLRFIEGQLYAFGSFQNIDGNRAHSVARWDGSEWQGVAPTTFTNSVFALEGDGRGGLYAGGFLTDFSSTGTNLYQIRNGEVIGVTANGAVEALEWWNGSLHALGGFSRIAGTESFGFAAWPHPDAAVELIISAPTRVMSGSLADLSFHFANVRSTNVANVRVKMPLPTGTIPVTLPVGATVLAGELDWQIPELAPGITNFTIGFNLQGPLETNLTFQSFVHLENFQTFRAKPTFTTIWDGNIAPSITNTTEVRFIIRLPTDLKLRADASDPDGSIARVEFYDGDRLLGVDAAPPYELPWPEMDFGDRRIRAAAVDDRGKRTFSTFRIMSVTPPASPELSSLTAIDADTLRVDAKGILGAEYALERSTDLSDWTLDRTFLQTESTVQLDLPLPSQQTQAKQLFWRLRLFQALPE